MTKINKCINKMLTNKYLLYLTTILSVITLLAYTCIQSFDTVALFIVIAGLTKYFSNNMSIVLLLSLVITNSYFIIKNIRNYNIQEGFKDKSKTSKSSKSSKNTNMTDTDTDENDIPTIDADRTNNSAFSSLQGMLGKEGLDGLTTDTLKLVDTQKQLKESMESLKPMMDTANGMLNSIDLKSMNKIGGMLKKFGIKNK